MRFVDCDVRPEVYVFDDPAVRSVRVAAALCDRFEELTKGPTQVTAAKQHGALIGVSGNETELSLRIGEAQQIYPEIWQHLDDARKTFGTRGILLSEYDSMREQEGQALGATVDVHGASYGAGSYGADHTTKSAAFNLQGLARARRAIGVLQRATPDIDWDSIAKAESADPAAAEFARAQRNKRLVRLGALALVVASPFLIVMYMRHRERAKRDAWREQYESRQAPQAPKLDADARDALAKQVAALRPQVARARAGWPTVAALADVKPGPQPCAVAITPPTGAAVDEYIATGRVAEGPFVSSHFYAFMPDQAPTALDLDSADAALSAIDKRIAKGEASIYETLPAIPKHISFVIIDREIKPTSSAPGQVVGRSFVYDVAQAKLVCAGTIDAKNAAASTNSEQLHREMEVRIRESLAANIRAL